jgi:hypothetical protein
MVLVDHLEAHVRLIPVLIGWLGSRAMVAAAPSPGRPTGARAFGYTVPANGIVVLILETR